MRAEDVLEFVQRRPFEPFRLTLTSGQTYDVVHPEFAIVGKSVVAVGVPEGEGESRVADRVATVSLFHITQLEPLQVRKPGGSNGPATK
jgi:hypothetical protein